MKGLHAVFCVTWTAILMLISSCTSVPYRWATPGQPTRMALYIHPLAKGIRPINLSLLGSSHQTLGYIRITQEECAAMPNIKLASFHRDSEFMKWQTFAFTSDISGVLSLRLTRLEDHEDGFNYELAIDEQTVFFTSKARIFDIKNYSDLFLLTAEPTIQEPE